MATSTEQINDLIDGCTVLKVYFERARDDIEARVQFALSQTPNFTRTLYVNQATGDDAATGQSGDPLASIAEAVSRVPSGGLLILNIDGDYHFTEIIKPENIAVDVRGIGATKPLLTFGWVQSTAEPDKIERMAGFQPLNRAEFRFSNLEIELPADPVDPLRYSHMNGVISGTQGAHPGIVSIKCSTVDFGIAAGSLEASLCGESPALTAINFQGCTFPASGFPGRVVKGIGGDAVDPDTVTRFVVTNLSWI